jgi:ABC-type spermidine/putrescine transport system permease subunit I
VSQAGAIAPPVRLGRGVPQGLVGLALTSPAIAMVLLLFILPILGSIQSAFVSKAGAGFDNFVTSYELYGVDLGFSVLIVLISSALVALFSVVIAGYLTLGTNALTVAILRWLYRWPLFIPFIVVGQILRTFLAKNGLMNNIFVASGLLSPLQTTSFLDWRGIVIAFVWKQLPFVTLLLAGAMAALDSSTNEAEPNLGASTLRILV